MKYEKPIVINQSIGEVMFYRGENGKVYDLFDREVVEESLSKDDFIGTKKQMERTKRRKKLQ